MDSFLSAMGFGSADEVPDSAPSLPTEPCKDVRSHSKLVLGYDAGHLGLAYASQKTDATEPKLEQLPTATEESKPAGEASPKKEVAFPPPPAENADATPVAAAADASPVAPAADVIPVAELSGPVFTGDSSLPEAPPAKEPVQAAPAPVLQPPPFVQEELPMAAMRTAQMPVKLESALLTPELEAPATTAPAATGPAPGVKLESALLTPEPEAPVAAAPAATGPAPSVKLESALLTPEPEVPAAAVPAASDAAPNAKLDFALLTPQLESPAADVYIVPDNIRDSSNVGEVEASEYLTSQSRSSRSVERATASGAAATPERPDAQDAAARPQPRRPASQTGGGLPWRLNGNLNNQAAPRQTSAYQRLGTSETNPSMLTAHAAVSEPSSAATNLSCSKVYPSPTARHSCGMARLALRMAYNQKEINAALLLQKFDANNNGVLEPEEFRALLSSWIADQHHGPRAIVKDEDLEYIMAVADKNHDDRISVDEILSALQAWYSFNYMPNEVSAGLVGKHGISVDGSPLPPVEKIKDILVDLNGFQPVDVEEAAFVRQLAISLGATEEKVTFLQLRRAVAIWYINVERERTDGKRLMEDSVVALASFSHHHSNRMWKKVPSTRDLTDSVAASAPPSIRRYLSGQVDPELGTPLQVATEDPELSPDAGEAQDVAEEPELVPVLNMSLERVPFYIPLFFWSVLFLLPGFYMVHVASVYTLKPTCEHDLLDLLLWKGYLTLLVGSCGLFYNTLNDGDFRNICFFGGILGFIVAFFQELVGLTYTLSCSPENCGDFLWNVNAVFFVWFLLWGPAVFCCMITLFGTIALSAVAHQRREMELALHPDKDAPPAAPLWRIYNQRAFAR